MQKNMQYIFVCLRCINKINLFLFYLLHKNKFIATIHSSNKNSKK